MDKLHMHTPNLADENFRKLAALFPNAVTETITGYEDVEENGRMVRKAIIERAIDKDVLMQEISAHVVEGREERYQFTWPDKKKAVLAANAPISATLRPVREDSVGKDGAPGGWDSENLYIEGDNLDVLKLLRETYLGKVKMIYIDPPYNTGNDFVYEDDFAEDADSYMSRSGQYDEQGNQLVQNTESNGRFHTDWLNMIYSRIRIAKDLLTDDGALLVHIDDNEYENLTKIGKEIFGDENFINIITIKTKVGGVSGSSEGKSLKDATEFIVMFARNKNALSLNPVYIKEKLFDRIRNYESEGKSWKYTSVMTKLGGKEIIQKDEKRGVIYYGYRELETMSIGTFARQLGITEEDVYNKYADRIFQTTNAQSSVRQTVIKSTQGYDYPMYGCEYRPIKGKNEGNIVEVLYKGDQRRMMMFLSDAVTRIDGIYYYLDKVTTLWDDIQYNNLTKEGSIEFPNGKKPIKLLQRLIELICDKESIVVDFFSGSSSTAHAVIQSNVEDRGSRKFIMVQLPEPCDDGSDFKKAGFDNICEIGKERIRRAGRKIKEEAGLTAQDLDIGFRVLRLDSSNMQDVYYAPDATKQGQMDFLTENIKPDRTPEDLLFQVMLELGILPSSTIKETAIDGKRVFDVADGFLLACFDTGVTTDTVTAIAKREPYYAVFRDSGLADDSTATNFDQLFETYSPSTVRKVL